jgi:DNA polymerase elongation subunit (family B)/intein/homing endonuclease
MESTTIAFQDIAYQIDFKTNSPIVHIFGRNIQDRTPTHTILTNCKPYFYVPENEVDRLNGCPELDLEPLDGCRPGESYTDIFGRPVRRIYTDLPGRVAKVRDRFSFTDESDILFERRVIVDKKIRSGFTEDLGIITPITIDYVPPRILFFDIEVRAPRGVMPSAQTVKYPVSTIQIKDSYTGKKFVITCGVPSKQRSNHIPADSETELYEIFYQLLKKIDPDILTGWYTNQFDLPYLIRRATALGIGTKGLCRINDVRCDLMPNKKYIVKVPGRQCFDMLDGFKKLKGSESEREDYGLKTISAEYGFPYKDYGAYIDEIYTNEDWSTLLTYCENDVDSLSIIEKETEMFQFFESVRYITGCKLEDTLHNSRIIETFLMHEGIAPMPRKRKVEGDPYEGAFVLEPPIGIHEHVGWVDLAALYPTIMRAFNLSPDKEKIVPRVLTFIVEERERLRAINKSPTKTKNTEYQEMVMKYLANSFYGVLGSRDFRLYNGEVAAKVTEYGRTISEQVRDTCMKFGYRPIYGDSISGSSIVKVYSQESKTFEFVQILSLFDHVDWIDGEKEYCNLTDVYVESIGSNGVSILSNVPYIMRHKCDKKMYRVSINNCWNIDVTEDHSLFVYENYNINKDLEQHKRCVTCSTSEIGMEYNSVIIRRSSIYPLDYVDSQNLEIEMYEYLGYHLANGSLQYPKSMGGKRAYYGSISFGQDDELYDYFIKFLIETGRITQNVHKDKRGKNDYKFNSVKFCTFLDENIGHSKNKHVPSFMFSETIENIQAFIRGYFTGDGTVMIRGGNPIIRVTCIHESILSDVRNLLYICGIPSAYFKENKSNHYKGKDSGTFSHHLIISDIMKFRDTIGFITQRKQERLSKDMPFKIKDGIDWSYSNKCIVSEIGTFDGYVYDLNVPPNHNFFANNILCHNTDSVAVTSVLSVNEGIILQNRLNSMLKQWSLGNNALVTFSLKFEKLHRSLLFKPDRTGKKAAKKRYAGKLIWSDKDGDCSKLNYTGIELKRSDQSKLTKTLLREFLEISLIEGNVEKGMTHVRNTYRRVKAGEISIYDVSIPKGVYSDREDPWVRGKYTAEHDYGHIFDPSVKMRLVYLKPREGKPVEVCIDDEFDLTKIEGLIDWNLHAEKSIQNKLESYMEALGYSWSYVVDGQQVLPWVMSCETKKVQKRASKRRRVKSSG